MIGFIQLTVFVIAVLVLPVCYSTLCGTMREQRVPNPPRVAFFFLFSTVGGWLLSFAAAPSGITAMCLVLVMTAAPFFLLLSSIDLAMQPERTKFHRIAMWLGFAYSAIATLVFVASVLLH